MDAIRDAVDDATRRIAPGTDPSLFTLECEGWINVNPTGGFNAPHDHPGWYWSGAYYVATPDPGAEVRCTDPTAGCIEFLDGRTNLRVLSHIDAHCMASKVVYRPEAGLLIPDENDETPGAVREDEVEKFKEFLDSVSPDDFKAT